MCIDDVCRISSILLSVTFSWMCYAGQFVKTVISRWILLCRFYRPIAASFLSQQNSWLAAECDLWSIPVVACNVDYRKELVEEVENMQEPRFDDLTYIEVFTIDPEGCKDMDDALSFKVCEEHSDCYQVYFVGDM